MDRWPFVGRATVLADVVDRVVSGRSVVIAGPPGVGKTRVLHEVLDAGLPWPTVSLTATRPTATLPLAALLPVLPDLLPDDHAPGMLLTAARSALRGLAVPRLVVAVDDVQWLDEVTALLLAQLVDGGEAVVLATLRTGEPAPDDVRALWQDRRSTRVELAPMDGNEVSALVEARVGAQVSPVAAARLLERSAGNVLFLQQLVDHAVRSGTGGVSNGVWDVDELPVADQISELVADRVRGLSDEGAEALTLIALGEPLELELAAAVAGPGPLEELERRNLVEVTQDRRRELIRPAHPLFADVVRSRTGRLQQRRLLGQLASALEAQGLHRRRDVLRLVLWSLDAGRSVAPALLSEAATEARFVLDDITAERLARAAHAAAPSFETAHVLVDVLYERGAFEEREAVLGAYVDDPDESIRALTAMARAIGLFWGLADDAAADVVLEAAEATVADPAWWWEIRATRATLASQSGHPRRAVALLDGFPAPAPGLRAEAQAALAWCFALGDIGRIDDAVAVIDGAVAARGDRDQHLTLYEVGLLVAARGVAMTAAGRLDDAEGLTEMGHGITVSEANRGGQGFFAAVLAWIALHRGDHSAAMRRYRESLLALLSTGHRGPARWAAGGLLFAAALARDPDAIAEGRRALDELGTHPAGLMENALERARAWADVAEGRLTEARERLDRAAQLASERGAVVDELATLADLAELGDARPDRAQALASQCDGGLAATRCEHVAAVAAGDARLLEHVALRYHALGMERAAASAAMAGSDAAARHGDLRESRRLAQLAVEWSAMCGVPESAVADLGMVTPLTRREREVAALAADGHSSREIADRLFLSVRTVDNHLSRVYVKLGIGGRSELRRRSLSV